MKLSQRLLRPIRGVTPRSLSTNSAAQFPVAKAVPGKPGYVFSPYDPNGGYVDVSGYPAGSKVKDRLLPEDFSGSLRFPGRLWVPWASPAGRRSSTDRSWPYLISFRVRKLGQETAKQPKRAL